MSILPKYTDPAFDEKGLPNLDSRPSSLYTATSVSTTNTIKNVGNPRTPLPPITLQQRNNTSKHSEIAIIASTYIIISVVGIIGVFLASSSERRDVDDCHNDASVSATETRFQIDLPVTPPLSFAHAKLIDLIWDLTVGQGGRLLHGWVMYQVATKAIAWMLECSVLSYSVLFSILFPENSFSSLWTLGRSLRRRQRVRVVLMTVFLIFSTLHILFFGAIWSAATGYQSPGTVSFAMADRSWITKDTDTLTVCWAIPPNRPELVGIVDDVVLGPNFGAVFRSFTDISYNNGWAKENYPKWDGASEDFWNIYSYARSKKSAQGFLDALNITSHPYRPEPSDAYSVEWDEEILDKDNVKVGGITNIRYTGNPGNRLPESIKGYQFMGVHQDSLTKEPENMFWRNWTTSPTVVYNNIDGDQKELEEYEKTSFSRSVFALNMAIPYAKDAGVVPYNSSLWYKDKRIPLPAPFLNFNSTTAWLPSPLGESICYNGKLVTEDFRIESHKACTGGTHYVWGFSSFITRLGLLLECLWCSVCLHLWLYSAKHSTLAKYNRPCTGTVRNLLDLSEVIKEELGPHTCLYSDKQLRKALADSPPVRFTTWENCDGIAHIGLASDRGGEAPSRRVQLDLGLGKEYG